MVQLYKKKKESCWGGQKRGTLSSFSTLGGKKKSALAVVCKSGHQGMERKRSSPQQKKEGEEARTQLRAFVTTAKKGQILGKKNTNTL